VKSILDLVLEHAEATPSRPLVTLYSAREKTETRSVKAIADRAARAASFYRSKGVEARDIVVLVGTHHLDFYAAWLGALWVGAVPTVLAEPSVRVDKSVYWSRLAALLRRIEAKMLAVDPKLKIDASLFDGLSKAAYDVVATGEGAVPPRVEADPSDLLLLQHSSGTTGLQKGVMLSHGAVMAHARAYLDALAIQDDDVVATWLPLYHDMGLIACFVTPLIANVPVVWLSPFEWVANPSLLLRAASEHKATLMWLPNFAYAFLAQRTREPKSTFDLSKMRAVIDCSEPVTEEALNAFADRFASDGFSKDAIHTCYAMAENVFAVTTSTKDEPPVRLSIDAKAWRESHRAVVVGDAHADRLVHVSNGPPVKDCEVRVAQEDGRTNPAFEAGRILVRSTFLFDGYFRSEEAKASLFDADGFYDTGDVGYVDDRGHVYVTGRRKDLVIIGGRNVYPQDVEQVVMESAPVHDGRVVCFGVNVKGSGTEGLVVLAESDEPEDSWPEVVRAMRASVPKRLDLDLVDARVVAKGMLRKSTSGKLARSGNREWYLDGRFGAPSPLVHKGE
jgi:acyl-CoA synthetase (AMP-forming)/AMP-acid ligase II